MSMFISNSLKRLLNRIRRIHPAATLLPLAILAALAVVPATAAPAKADNPTFVYPGGWREGGNPATTGCAAGAQTVQSVPIYGWETSWYTGKNVRVYNGTLELRYSPRCQTNWARAHLVGHVSPYTRNYAPATTSWAPAVIRIEGGVSDRYYNYVYAATAYDVVIYTDMVYSPTMARPSPYEDPPDCARAKISLYPWDMPTTVGPIGATGGKWGEARTDCF